MKEKYTSTGMPVISGIMLQTITDRFANRGKPESPAWGKYLMEVQQRIIREDPNLVKFLER